MPIKVLINAILRPTTTIRSHFVKVSGLKIWGKTLTTEGTENTENNQTTPF